MGHQISAVVVAGSVDAECDIKVVPSLDGFTVIALEEVSRTSETAPSLMVCLVSTRCELLRPDRRSHEKAFDVGPAGCQVLR